MCLIAPQGGSRLCFIIPSVVLFLSVALAQTMENKEGVLRLRIEIEDADHDAPLDRMTPDLCV